MLTVRWQQAMARRMARQGLIDGADGPSTPLEAVERMVGAQAQVQNAAELSVAMRTPTGTVADVREAIARGELVRMTGLRGTIHLVAAAELGTWVAVFGTLPVGRFPSTQEEQPTPDQIEVLCAAIAATVAEQGPCTLDELHDGVVDRAGPWAADPVMPAFQGMWPRWRLVQGVAARRGLWVYGPNRGRAVTFAAPPPFEPVEQGVRVSETASPGARYRIGAYRFWHRHVASLLSLEGPDVDADALAHTLLAPLAAEHLTAVVAELGADRVRTGIVAVVAGTLGR